MKFERHTLLTIYHYRLCNLYETLYSVNLYMLYTVPDTVAMVLVRAFEKKKQSRPIFRKRQCFLNESEV